MRSSAAARLRNRGSDIGRTLTIVGIVGDSSLRRRRDPSRVEVPTLGIAGSDEALEMTLQTG